MTEIPQFSPGCFGSAIAFKKHDTVCRSCAFAIQCEPAHLEAQAVLRERYGIKTTSEELESKRLARELEKAEREAAKPSEVLALPKKTQELIDRLDRGNYDVIGKLKRGENPFGSAMRFMQIFAHILLNSKGVSVDRGLITTAFVRKFDWQQSTAEAHARIAIQALEHIGAISDNDGIISLRTN